eukprot:c25102_g1_i1 orf=57-2447(+)
MRPHLLIISIMLATKLLLFLSCINLVKAEQPIRRTVWIVILGGGIATPTNYSRFASGQESMKASHYTILSSVLPSEEVPQKYILYSYTKSFNEFSARLTPQEAGNISTLPGVAWVFQSRFLQLHTTRSWTVLGLSSQSPEFILSQRKLLIGVMDTGVWDESESLWDFDRLPKPLHVCCDYEIEDQADPGMYKKVPQQSKYPKEQENGVLTMGNIQNLAEVEDTYLSALDFNGHGTHTATIAAGNAIIGANLSGLAAGESQGGVPGARVASYKVCWGEGHCGEADVLAAFDDAISYGVDVLSLSFGGPSVPNLFADAIALGSFYATKKGIIVVCSAGNNGPDLGEATNVAPWVITVGASNIDRQFYTSVVLGNNVSLEGRAINTDVPKGFYPLIQGSKAGFSLKSLSSNCSQGSLDPTKVKGKLVVCESGSHPEQSSTVFFAGGVGMIIIDTSTTEIGAFTFGIPTSVIGVADGDTLISYIQSSGSPTAQILATTNPLQQPSPLLAAFSSRGPSRVNYQVFKPDVTAPGVSILAAWTAQHSITNEPQDHRNVSYNIASGTSIACPHVAGAAAYVKVFHPDWSIAAIKSALMTTAMPLDTSVSSNNDGEFGYGSGQIQPHKAINPGLIYDIGWEDYAEWLCGQGYEAGKMRLLTSNAATCTKKMKRDLNYPAISLPVEGGSKEASDRWWSFTRTVTNVGAPNSVYKVELEVPVGMNVVVTPANISFSKLNQKKTFVIKVQAPGLKTSTNPRIGDRLSASLVWNDGVFLVRSPIVAWIAPNALQLWPRSPTTPSIGFRV